MIWMYLGKLGKQRRLPNTIRPFYNDDFVIILKHVEERHYHVLSPNGRRSQLRKGAGNLSQIHNFCGLRIHEISIIAGFLQCVSTPRPTA